MQILKQPLWQLCHLYSPEGVQINERQINSSHHAFRSVSWSARPMPGNNVTRLRIRYVVLLGTAPDGFTKFHPTGTKLHPREQNSTQGCGSRCRQAQNSNQGYDCRFTSAASPMRARNTRGSIYSNGNPFDGRTCWSHIILLMDTRISIDNSIKFLEYSANVEN